MKGDKKKKEQRIYQSGGQIARMDQHCTFCNRKIIISALDYK
jgi:hypothetical protein